MTSAELYKFQMLLKGGCCDLLCSLAREEGRAEGHDEMNLLIEWRKEGIRGEGNSG